MLRPAEPLLRAAEMILFAAPPSYKIKITWLELFQRRYRLSAAVDEAGFVDAKIFAVAGFERDFGAGNFGKKKLLYKMVPKNSITFLKVQSYLLPNRKYTHVKQVPRKKEEHLTELFNIKLFYIFDKNKM